MRGEPIIKNSPAFAQTKVSLLEGNRLEDRMAGDVATSTMDTFLRARPFQPALLGSGQGRQPARRCQPERERFRAAHGPHLPGRSGSSTARYWIVYPTADTPELEKRVCRHGAVTR